MSPQDTECTLKIILRKFLCVLCIMYYEAIGDGKGVSCFVLLSVSLSHFLDVLPGQPGRGGEPVCFQGEQVCGGRVGGEEK